MVYATGPGIPPRQNRAMSSFVARVLTLFGLQAIPGPGAATSTKTIATPPTTRVSHIPGGGATYPPRDPGIPIASAEDLMASHAELMAMLRLHAADTPDNFHKRFELPIFRLAKFLNVLPGSASSSFSGAGGLLRACLETAFSAFRSSDGRIFTGSLGVEDRHRLEARWRYVCFCAGLIYPIAGSLEAMTVTDTAGSKWAPELEGLSAWAAVKQQERIYVTWSQKHIAIGPAPLAATFALDIVGRVNVEWLHEGSPELVRAMLQIVTGSTGAKGLIAESVVREIFAAVVEREDARRPQNYGRLTVGSHIAPYLLDAFAALSKDEWVMNERVLYGDSAGVYLAWPQAGKDIINYCQKQGYQGVPAQEAALLSILISESFLVAGVEGVALIEIANADGEIEAAVKLKQPALLLPEGKTLMSFATARPVEMGAVHKADPLTSSSQNNEKKSRKPSGSPSEAKSAPVLEQLDLKNVLMPNDVDEALSDESEELDGEEGLAAGSIEQLDQASTSISVEPVEVTQMQGVRPGAEADTRRPAKATKTAPRAPTHLKGEQRSEQGAVVEAPEIKYSNLLSSEVVTRFRPFENEVLGRLVHVWRTQSQDGHLMRMCENGMAIELALLGEFVKDPVTFLNTLGTAGFLYTAPMTPSKMVYPVPVADGSSKSALSFIIGHHALKKLGIP